METKYLNGKWIGKFKYNQIKGLPRIKLIDFEITLHFTDNNFTGSCIDELTIKLFTEPAFIVGTLSPNYISFNKRYPCMVSSDEQLNPIIIKDEPSVDIHYTGLLTKTFLLANMYLQENGALQICI